MASEQGDMKQTVSAPDPVELTVQSAVEQARRAFALRKYEQAVDHYATALELMTKDKGDNSPETADLYFAYGKALLENAISQATVLGKEQQEDTEEAEAPGPSTNGAGPILSFSGDAEDPPPEDEDPAIDLFGQAAQEGQDEDEEREEEEEGDDAEPEDDFNAAWEVLDLARAIYEKQVEREDDIEVKLKLADTFIALGDVSLETEKFDQAITDYEAGLALKGVLLPVSSRHIAEAHYKLSMVLDLTSGRLADAIVHAEKALESVETRLAELRNALSGQTKVEPNTDQKEDVKKDVKGKGKAKGTRLIRDDVVQNMSQEQIETEIKELDGLKEDLALKVEELKTTPNETQLSAPAMAAQELERELNAGVLRPKEPLPVNDLTSMVVKKKKKKAPEESSSKRKAEEDRAASPPEKRVKVEEKTET